ncbi:hypothetical protein [Pistricoccus aurantiacus]|uniref:hypothetical protein n=1 Tax=Pistricoccus aurantiacus TaxID=1883414 RepID=UPI0036449F69
MPAVLARQALTERYFAERFLKGFPMRLQILSDLQLEHFDEGRDIPRKTVDAVMLAEDTHSADRGLERAAA